jgi:hypothetical protein
LDEKGIGVAKWYVAAGGECTKAAGQTVWIQGCFALFPFALLFHFHIYPFIFSLSFVS